MSNDSFQLTQHLTGPPTAVYHAWIEPEQLQQWFRPDENHRLTLVESDLRTGGDFRFDLIGGNGETLRFGGLYRRLAPPRRLVFTWHWADEAGIDGLSEDTYVEITLAETDEQTTSLTLFHDEFLTEADLDWHRQFWQGILSALHDYLSDTDT
jgi:uncharacterized protein YndB with AHSA1/START domain